MTQLPEQKLDEPTIAIVGVGLIGGSIATALKQSGYKGTIIGVGRNQQRLNTAVTANIIDEGITDLTKAASRSSLMIFCTPVNLIVEGVLSAAPHCASGTLMTDTGSVKGVICHHLKNKLPPNVHFIGSHPLAGSEKQGYENSSADLYQNKVCIVTPEIITPEENVPSDQQQRLQQLWEFIGMKVSVMSPTEHDNIVARTSHLPHLLASAMVQTVLTDETVHFAASGFRDTTRIAAGDADLWTSILLDNADAVLDGLEKYCEVLKEFRRTLHNRDAQALKNLLQNAKTTREQLR